MILYAPKDVVFVLKMTGQTAVSYVKASVIASFLSWKILSLISDVSSKMCC